MMRDEYDKFISIAPEKLSSKYFLQTWENDKNYPLPFAKLRKLNADVYISNDILELILDDKNEAVMAIDKRRIETGDYFFGTDTNGIIEKYGKDLPIDERTCEYVGLCKIQKSFCKAFTDRMEELILQYKHDLWRENILYSFTGEKDIHTIDVGGLFWSEIDYFDDYERILNHIKNII